jgi:predicted DNA-binding protein YlxM (UPF0122 family)
MRSAEATNSLLYDYYGALLGERQNEIFQLYHEDNLTLAEIAEGFGISRQAVHTALKKAEQALSEFERDLGLVAKHETYERVLSAAAQGIGGVLEGSDGVVLNPVAARTLRRIIKLIKELDI